MDDPRSDEGLLDHDRAALEAEIAALRLRLSGVQSEVPRRVRQLEERLMELKGQIAQETAKNEKLSFTLREARENIVALRDEVDKLSQPPSAYGVVVGKNEDQT
ncbi:MAG: proteasome-associated ATPase, partial [Actinomycetota bacterium]